jgi:transposase-like protein
MPRVNDKRVDPDTGERQRFASAILPPWTRKTPRITEVLPLLYPHGLSSRGLRAGALGFWGALREVFPQTREQRCWFHKIDNVLTALPNSAHPGANKTRAQVWNAEDKQH